MGGFETESGKPTSGLGSRQASILVADEATEMRTLVRITLESQGWIVHEAAAPAAVLEVAQRELPDAILVGVDFEGEADDGFVVCRKLRANPATARIPVVMLTARSTASERAIAQGAGAAAYLPKPFGPTDLIDTLRAILDLPGSGPALGVLLIDEGRIDPEDLAQALEQQQRFRDHGIQVPLGEVLMREGSVTSDDVERALERQRASGDLVESGPRRIRVLIADANHTVRDGLRAIFVEDDGFTVVGVATNGDEALRLLRERRADVAVLDQDLRKLSGLELIELIRQEQIPTAPIVYSFDQSVRAAVLAAGASFVDKGAHPAALASEVRRAGGREATPHSATARPSLARAASTFAVRAMARQRRSIGIFGVLTVGYAGAFLVAESLLGAGAALLAIAPVALAGALIGPELGVAAAVIASAETFSLWAGTGHAPGEAVLVVGAGGLGPLALMGIGAGFGAMRLVRGQLHRRRREIETVVAAGLLLERVGPGSVALVTDAARAIVDADAIITYGPADAGALTVLATSGAPASLLGQRETARFGPVLSAYNEASPRVLGELEARSFIPKMRSGVVVPACPYGERPGGVIVALSASRLRRLDQSDAAALLRFAPAAWLALKMAREPQPLENEAGARELAPSRGATGRIATGIAAIALFAKAFLLAHVTR